MDENMNESVTETVEENVTETKEETDKKCPACGGIMEFNPDTGGLSCPFCGHTEEIEAEEEASAAEELDFDEAEHTANCDWGAAKKIVVCKACAAESVYDSLETASVCPFCGSNQVMEANTEDTIAPGGVVKFKITAKEAAEKFRNWIKSKWYSPKLAKESAKPKSFHGIYLPYWTFDTDASASYTAEYGIDESWTDSDGEEHTKTNWHRTLGHYSEFIDDELVYASTKHDADMIEDLEPFDTEDNVKYKPEYVAGFAAERYSIGLQEAWKIAKKKIKELLHNRIEEKIRREHHADHVRSIDMVISHSNIKYKYLLLPVWLSNYKYKEKVYQFMVNGQTGEVSGKTPISAPRVIIASVIGLAIVGVICYFLFT